tara:strand:+ start:37 stop:594 length:558 start_codon:yes stop_codon:yes gene_type:complete
VCTNPHKHTAKLEKHKRDYQFASNENKFRNKEASWKMGQNRNVIGLSRGRSDVQTKALDIVGKGRKILETATKEYAMKGGSLAGQGGRSATAGRNSYLALLSKTAEIESKIGNTLGRDYASANQGLDRQYMNKVALNRQKLGLPSEYGPAVFEQQQSPWEKIQPVIGAVSTISSIGTNNWWNLDN